MKSIKSILTAIISVTIAVTIIVGSSLNTYAIVAAAQAAFKSQGYGSFEKGVVPPQTFYSWHHPSIKGMEDIGHPNLNFEMGLQYWTVHNDPLGPAAFVKLNKESNGNHYITLTPKAGYDGIASVKFPLSKLKPGDTPGLLYKWRGDAHAFQVVLEQYVDANEKEEGGHGVRIGHDGARGATPIWTADEDDKTDWNIHLAINLKPVQQSKYTSFYHVLVEATGNPEISTGIQVDDIQIVIHNDAAKKVYDLDGKLIYDLNNLPKPKVDDYVLGKNISEKDDRAKHNIDVNKLLKNKDKLDVVAIESNDMSDSDTKLSGNDGGAVKSKSKGGIFTKSNSKSDSNDDSSLGAWLWVIIAAAVLLLIGAGVVVFIIIKKKKANVNQDAQAEAPEEPQQYTQE